MAPSNDRVWVAGCHVVVGRNDADIICGVSHVEVLGNLLLIEETVVAAAQRLHSSKIMRIFKAECDRLILFEGFDNRRLIHGFEWPSECF